MNQDHTHVLSWLSDELFESVKDLIIKKNSDYSGVHVFSNVSACRQIGVDPKIGILVRMMDKISRLSTLCNKKPDVSNESFQDTLIDLVGYGVLLYGLEKLDRTQAIIDAVCRVLSVSVPCLTHDELLKCAHVIDRFIDRNEVDDSELSELVSRCFGQRVSVDEFKQAVQHVV